MRRSKMNVSRIVQNRRHGMRDMGWEIWDGRYGMGDMGWEI
jgi:hypothetical protein